MNPMTINRQDQPGRNPTVSGQIKGKGKKRGQTLVEYGLILALISILLISVLTVLNGTIIHVFNSVTNTLQNSPAMKGNT